MSADLIGKVVNGYEIISQVGQGGMATVYLARQQTMNRNVALKFLPSAFMNDSTYLQRFEREARIVAQLEHRNIVPVYDYGDYEDQPYIAMRYMPAGSVEQLLARGRITLPTVLSIVEQAAAALDYAHQKGILHRDLKPSNILLDDGGGAFITDFGIARILGEGSGKITTQGVVGTPSYMSPEQAQGEPLDGRSDVYGLGVMLFELVTGRRPFISETPYSIAVMHVTMPPPSPREFEPSLPIEVEQVILRALSKSPQARFASCGELAGALRRAIDGEPRSTAALPAASPSQPPAATTGKGPATPKTNNWHMPTLADGPPTRPEASVWSRRMWLGMAAGGALGCGLLLVLLALGLSLIGRLANDAASEPAATQSPTVPASPPASVEPLQLTLGALNAAADATFAAQPALQPTNANATSLVVQPVGLRELPVLTGALREATGELLYFAPVADEPGSDSRFEIAILDLASGQERRFDPGGSSSYPQASADGRWIAFQSDRDGDFEILVANRLGGQLRQLTRNDVWDRLPTWSPDGGWIVYSSDARGDGTFDLYRVRPDGSAAQPVYSDGGRNSHARFSPDGSAIVFTSGAALRDARSWELRLMHLDDGSTRLLTQNDVRDASPVFSPDGRRILYVTTIGGARALASMDAAGGDREILYSGPGSVWAGSYSPDGRFIAVTATVDGLDQVFIMEARGGPAQQLTLAGGAYASWLPALE